MLYRLGAECKQTYGILDWEATEKDNSRLNMELDLGSKRYTGVAISIIIVIIQIQEFVQVKFTCCLGGRGWTRQDIGFGVNKTEHAQARVGGAA